MVNLGFWSHFATPSAQGSGGSKKASRDKNKPILCLAPMADVTDSAFRFVISKCSQNNSLDTFSSLGTDISLLRNSSARPSRPPQGPLGEVSQEFLNKYVTWTEFVSADGLVLAHEEGKKKLLKDLEYSEIERPIVAQLFGSKPENMEKAGFLVASLGFDGLDINMGCPDKSIEKQGAGAAMIKTPALAREIIRSAKAGVERYAKEAGKEAIPVSVKTRLGYNKDELDNWLPELLAEEPAAITIHARTRKEMSKVPARWERIKKAVEIRDAFQQKKMLPEDTDIFLLKNSSCSPQSGSQAPQKAFSIAKTLIFGNGDVEDIEDAYKKAEESGADGVMLGRAIFGNPFLFSGRIPTTKEKLEALIEHIKLFDQNLGKVKNFAVMKKHFKSYLLPLTKYCEDAGIQKEFKALKDSLMSSSDSASAIFTIDEFIHKHLK